MPTGIRLNGCIPCFGRLRTFTIKQAMKILFINSFYAPHIAGGAELTMKIIVEGLQHKGHEVVVVATNEKGKSYKEVINGVPVYRVGIKNVFWHYYPSKTTRLQRWIWKLLDTYNPFMKGPVNDIINIEKPDIVFCHNLAGFSISMWDLIKSKHIPIVQIIHDYYLLCPLSLYNKNKKCSTNRCLKCKITRFLHKKKSPKVDNLVCISNYVCNLLEKYNYFTNVKKDIIHNIRIINTKEENIQRTKCKNLGYIGTLSSNKGVNWLISQFKMIKNDNINLYIAGKPTENSYLDELKQLIGNDTRIIYLGYMASTDFFKKIDCLVVPSLWEEPLGMVAIEACANGIPTIINNSGGLPEIIKSEYNGLICNFDNDLNSLYDSMNRIINDEQLYRLLITNTKKSVEYFLSIDRLVNQYNDIIQGLK